MIEAAKKQAAAMAVERAARESYGRLVAYLAARTGDVAGAEDALAEAFASALGQWPADGVPANPAAWLLTVARRKRIDALRRAQPGAMQLEHLKLMTQEMADGIEAAAAAPDDIPDRRLALMFACAHPAIEPAIRTPLILQAVLGLTAADIAAAFLVPPATMGQRLVRAKARIREAGIAFAIPASDEWPGRLDAVLETVYAAYAKGWVEAGEAGPPALAGEAIWLGRVIVHLLPDEPEAKGMLAPMLHAEARRPARRDAAGAYVPLDAQDAGLWDRGLIDEAERLLAEANAGGPSGRYQIEAAIQSAHAARLLFGVANRDAVAALYDLLAILAPSPVVTLNRAMARAEIDGSAAALAAIAPLSADRRMADYQPYWAARGHLCAAAGQRDAAYEALTLAIGLTADPAVRRYLQQQRDRLRNG
ncbi:MAG: RNA polymerase subunit sigma-70 [Rhizobiales bacterium]|nr:RNA polymerase subunit sigma-70 [Hyphomicrobiales bacterium]